MHPSYGGGINLGGGIGDGIGDSSVEDELVECVDILEEEVFGSPWGKGSPGNELLSSDIPSPSCNSVTDDTEENVDRFCEQFLLIVSPS